MTQEHQPGAMMPPWMRWGKRKAVKPRTLRRTARRCRVHPERRANRCRCSYCRSCCRKACKDPTQRGQSGCGHFAFCLACGGVFLFDHLTITGPDLCPACQRGG
jgi:hypothetical protein